MVEVKMVGIISVMLLMELMDVTCNTISKVAMSKGLSSFIYTTYSHGIAFFFLIPLAFLFHRRTPVPPIGVSIIFRLFLLGCSCGACSILSMIGIRYSSPTLASAMNNLSPAITFLMGIIFRMEILNPRALSSLLKLIGTFVSISGAFIVTFYQGIPIIIFPAHSPNDSLLLSLLRGTDQPNWVLGGLFLFASCVFLSLSFVIKRSYCFMSASSVLLKRLLLCSPTSDTWVVLRVALTLVSIPQTWIVRDFHSEVLITLISFFFETIVAALVTFVAEEDTSVWTPSVQIIWICLLFGALEVGVVNTVQTWACGKKGPLFVAMFKPLQMVIAVILGVSFLKDILHLGSVIGGTIIGIGFYTVMKGKADEEMAKENDEYSPGEDTSHKVPLLQNKNTNV